MSLAGTAVHASVTGSHNDHFQFLARTSIRMRVAPAYGLIPSLLGDRPGDER